MQTILLFIIVLVILFQFLAFIFTFSKMKNRFEEVIRIFDKRLVERLDKTNDLLEKIAQNTKEQKIEVKAFNRFVESGTWKKIKKTFWWETVIPHWPLTIWEEFLEWLQNLQPNSEDNEWEWENSIA